MGLSIMRRLIFLNRFFFPDHSATSQILGDLAFHLAACGREVHVITSQQIYDNPKAGLPATEMVRGVNVLRIPTTKFGRSGLLGRGLDYLSFYRSMSRSVLSLAGPGDVLIAMTDPPMISVPAMRAARSGGSNLVNWLQDLYPEVAIELGVPLLKGPLGNGLSHLRDRSLKIASGNVVVGQRMAERIVARGVPPERVHIIHNWCDDQRIRPIPHEENPLRRQWGLEGKFVVGYSGNLGRAHEFQTVLAAARHFADDPRIIFLITGDGHHVVQLRQEVKKLELDRIFRFMSYQERDLLNYSLGTADVHWVSLRPELEGLIVPSKFFGIAAAGRPTIAITSRDGEIALLVKKHACGVVVRPGDTDALISAILLLSGDAQRTHEMGIRARQMVDAHFTQRQALERWRSLLENL
jgi:colanic acid biosynthesis glycosyl transferase WcaI